MAAVYDTDFSYERAPPLKMKESSVDVLIIGAGPAGLMAATALSKAGVAVRIIDKKLKKVQVGQADGIQSRTIEVLQSYGLGERLLRETNHVCRSAFYNPAPDGGIALSERYANCVWRRNFRARYPFSVSLHQGGIESILLDSMAGYGLGVDRGLEPSALELDESEDCIQGANGYPVKVMIRSLKSAIGENDTEIVYAKYVLGSDGAHSWVRKQLGFTLDGEHTNYVWGVVDAVPDTDFPDIRSKCAIHSNHGSLMIIPREGDLVRFYSQLSGPEAQEVVNARGRVDLSKWGPDRMIESTKKQLQPFKLEIKRIDWWTLYLIGQRVASAFSKKERIFIAGDACHTHSPKAGQGMNASMNDSHNLVWKLAYVLRGWADRSLLKTYEFERRKYAQDLINFDIYWAKLFSMQPHSEENKDGVTHEEMSAAATKFSAFTSGVGIQYEPSAITNPTFQSLATGLAAGSRIPPHSVMRVADGRQFELQDLLPSNTRFKVLVFSGDVALESQNALLHKFAEDLAADDSFLNNYGSGSVARDGDATNANQDTFDVLTIVAGENVSEVSVVPGILRPHWSNVLSEDVDIAARESRMTYESFGISRERGAVVIVRPDGYVGMIAPLDGIKRINDYFAGFMIPISTS